MIIGARWRFAEVQAQSKLGLDLVNVGRCCLATAVSSTSRRILSTLLTTSLMIFCYMLFHAILLRPVLEFFLQFLKKLKGTFVLIAGWIAPYSFTSIKKDMMIGIHIFLSNLKLVSGKLSVVRENCMQGCEAIAGIDQYFLFFLGLLWLPYQHPGCSLDPD